MDIVDQIVKIIEALCEKLGIAVDWTTETVGPYVEEIVGKFIKFEIASSIFNICIVVFLSALCWGILLGTMKEIFEKMNDVAGELWAALWVVMVIITGIVSIITLINVGMEIYDIIMAKVFPERLVFEYVSSQLSSSNG